MVRPEIADAVSDIAGVLGCVLAYNALTWEDVSFFLKGFSAIGGAVLVVLSVWHKIILIRKDKNERKNNTP